MAKSVCTPSYPNSQGSVALSGTAWVTIEFVYSYMTMFVIVTSVIILLIDSMPQYYDSNPYYRLKSACMLISESHAGFVYRLRSTLMS